MINPPNPRTVSISSGGARGVVALGALAELQAAGLLRDVREWCGTSVGAVLAAGCAMGRSPRRMLEIAARHPLELDGALPAGRPRPAPHHFGLDSGRGLQRWIQRLLGLSRPVTLAQLHAQTGVTLRVCVCNVTDRRAEYWTHRTHPDVSLVKALRASCGIPVVFATVRHGGKEYVDGAVADPLVVADAREQLSVWFDDPPAPLATLGDYVAALRDISLVKRPPAGGRRALGLDPGGVGALDVHLAPEAMRAAYASGRAQARRWVKKNA